MTRIKIRSYQVILILTGTGKYKAFDLNAQTLQALSVPLRHQAVYFLMLNIFRLYSTKQMFLIYHCLQFIRSSFYFKQHSLFLYIRVCHCWIDFTPVNSLLLVKSSSRQYHSNKIYLPKESLNVVVVAPTLLFAWQLYMPNLLVDTLPTLTTPFECWIG